MTGHCYDTTVLVDLLRNRPRAVRLLRRHRRADRATTAVTAYELALGATTAVRRRAALGLLETLEVLPLDSHVAWVAGEVMRDLKSEGREAPFRDLLIAVVARERGWALHTFDRGFPDIPGLDLRREA